MGILGRLKAAIGKRKLRGVVVNDGLEHPSGSSSGLDDDSSAGTLAESTNDDEGYSQSDANERCGVLDGSSLASCEGDTIKEEPPRGARREDLPLVQKEDRRNEEACLGEKSEVVGGSIDNEKNVVTGGEKNTIRPQLASDCCTQECSAEEYDVLICGEKFNSPKQLSSEKERLKQINDISRELNRYADIIRRGTRASTVSRLQQLYVGRRKCREKLEVVVAEHALAVKEYFKRYKLRYSALMELAERELNNGNISNIDYETFTAQWNKLYIENSFLCIKDKDISLTRRYLEELELVRGIDDEIYNRQKQNLQERIATVADSIGFDMLCLLANFGYRVRIPKGEIRLSYSIDTYLEYLKSGIWGNEGAITKADFEKISAKLIERHSYVDLSSYVYYVKSENIIPKDEISEWLKRVCAKRIHDIIDERYSLISSGQNDKILSYTDRKILEKDLNVLYGNGFILENEAIGLINSYIDEKNKSIERIACERKSNIVETAPLRYESGRYIINEDLEPSNLPRRTSLKYNNVSRWSAPESRSRAQLIIKDHGVRSLYHFSQLSNLGSIVKNGILPVEELRSRGIDFSYNDDNRFDGRTDSTSVSVSFPNYKMFYKLRCENLDSHWVIFEIDPSILKFREFVLYSTNAAKGSGMSQTDSVEQFFGQSNDQFPEDPQAEILIKGMIPESFIKNIYVYSNYDLEKTKRISRKIKINRKFFGKRDI